MSATDVARCLVQLSASEPEPDLLTLSRLQKLLYYAQAWHLALFDVPLFPERIDAGKDGPVIREIAEEFADCAAGQITPERAGVPTLSADAKKYIKRFWEGYKSYSVSKLHEMVGEESPWRNARANFLPNELIGDELTQETLRAFFKSKLIPGLDPLKCWEEESEGAYR